MAKAKKTESASESAPKKKAPEKKAPAKKPAAARPALLGDTPMIDTSLAAQSAARMLTAGLNKTTTSNTSIPRQESALFKQMKAGLNKPHAAAMSNLLEKSQGPEPAKTHSNMKQVGQNQTQSADVTRSGVPRRNPG